MIRINLLPFRAARKQENIRQQVSVFVLIVIFLSIILVWYSNSLGNKSENLRVSIANTQKELKTYNEINKEIADIKKKLKVLKTKTEVIDQLQIKRKEPVQMLEAMTQLIVEERMWFTSFKTTERVQANTSPAKARKGKAVPAKQTQQTPGSVVDIVVKGIALDNKTVADFMTRLETSFVNVNLRTIRQVNIRGLSLMEFEINFRKLQSADKQDAAA